MERKVSHLDENPSGRTPPNRELSGWWIFRSPTYIGIPLVECPTYRGGALYKSELKSMRKCRIRINSWFDMESTPSLIEQVTDHSSQRTSLGIWVLRDSWKELHVQCRLPHQDQHLGIQWLEICHQAQEWQAWFLRLLPSWWWFLLLCFQWRQSAAKHMLCHTDLQSATRDE